LLKRPPNFVEKYYSLAELLLNIDNKISLLPIWHHTSRLFC